MECDGHGDGITIKYKDYFIINIDYNGLYRVGHCYRLTQTMDGLVIINEGVDDIDY